MSDYSEALKRYLKADGNNQLALAEKVGCQQASISRYSNGRLPPREIAEKIDDATEGSVPLALWIAAAAKRYGLAA